MAIIIELKRSSVPGKVPSTTDLALGELAINTYDGKLFLKKNVSGTETIVDISSGGGTGSISASYATTASFASTASFLLGSVANAVSASFATTASYALNVVSSTTNTGSLATTASLNSYTASLNAFSASILNYTASQNILNGTFATTGSNTFRGNQVITGSLLISSSAATELTVVGNSIFTGSTTISGSSVSGALSIDCFTPATSYGSLTIKSSGNVSNNAVLSLINTQQGSNYYVTGSSIDFWGFQTDDYPFPSGIYKNSFIQDANYSLNFGSLNSFKWNTFSLGYTGSTAYDGGFGLTGNPIGTNLLTLNSTNLSSSVTVVAPSFTGNLTGTASFASNALSASYARSASLATTADVATTIAVVNNTGDATRYLVWAATGAGNRTPNITTQRFVVNSATGSMGINKSTIASGYILDVGGNALISGSFTVITGSGIEFQVTNTGVKIGNSTTDNHTVTGSVNVSGSNTLVGTKTITGSVFISGSKTVIGTNTITGSLLVTGSTTQIGNNTLIGNTLLTGSLTISGSNDTVINPTINIFGDTQTNGVIKFLPVNKSINTSLSASYIFVSGSTQDLYFSQNGSGYANTTRLRWLESNLYTGILSGGIITSTPGSTTWNISAGTGIIVAQNALTSSSPYPTVQYVTWNDITNIPITYSGSAKLTYVGLDNTATPVQQIVPWGSTDINQFDTQINLGVVLHLSGSVSTGVFSSPQISYGPQQKVDDFTRAFGPLKISGHTLQASGSSPTLSIKKTGGSAYKEGANYRINPNHPSTTIENDINTSKIYRYYISGSTPVIDTGINNAGYTEIDSKYYVDTTTGALALVGGAYWSIQRVFWIPNSPTNAFIVYYGNDRYRSLVDATNAKDSEPFIEAPNTATNAIFLGYIIIQGGGSGTPPRDLLNASEATIIPGGIFRNVGGIGSSGTSPLSNTLAGLSDVSIPGRVAGDLLYYNGSQWVNSKSLTGNYSITGSFATNDGITAVTVTANSFTGSLLGTSSYAQNADLLDGLNSTVFATTGSNTFNGNQIITGSLAVGTSSLGPYENNITLGARDAANEGGQIGFNAPGGTFASASFIDNWSNFHRILRGTNASSTGLVAQWNLGTLQMELPGYTNASSFTGSATANLAVDSSGKVITVSTSGGTVFPYTGNAVITGSLTATTGLISPVNGGAYLRGGDDAELWDINVANTVGLYGQQDQTVGSLKLGSGGGTISGRSGNIGIGTITPTSASLTVDGNIWAASLTGSLLGTASFATSASYAVISRTADIATTITAVSNTTDDTRYLVYVATGAGNRNPQINTSRLVVNPASGSLGIGKSTITTGYYLDVAGNTLISGSLLVTGSITGSLFGTAETASFITVQSNALDALRYPLFVATGVGTRTANISANRIVANGATGSLGLGKNNISTGYTLDISGSAVITGSIIVTSSISSSVLGQFTGNNNGYVEFSVRNTSNGISASGDIAVYADNGTVTNNYIDMGINNSGLSNAYFYGGTDFGDANDAYLYNVGGNLRIGNATSTSPSQSLYLFSNTAARPDISITGSRVGINKGTGSLNASLDVSGSTTITGSVQGNVSTLTISTNTASIDLNLGNFFTLTLSGSTHFTATNIKPGQTVNILLTTNATNNSASFNSTIFRQPTGSAYTPTGVNGAKDILTLVSYDATNLYVASVKNLV
jgi:hypothetical protein